MTVTTVTKHESEAQPPSAKLQLLPRRDTEPGARADAAERDSSLRPTRRRAPQAAAQVLIAGRDPAARDQVLHEIMPAQTRFLQSGTFWEVLVHAPDSRIVILSGELDDVPAESLLHTLAHRHPDLPVVSIDAPVPSAH
jgi:hypothetical protein